MNLNNNIREEFWKTQPSRMTLRGFKAAVEEAIVHVVETARKLILTHHKTLTDKELMLMYEQRKQLLEMGNYSW